MTDTNQNYIEKKMEQIHNDFLALPELFRRGFYSGWREAARWANRSDLGPDTDSTAYAAAALREYRLWEINNPINGNTKS